MKNRAMALALPLISMIYAVMLSSYSSAQTPGIGIVREAQPASLADLDPGETFSVTYTVFNRQAAALEGILLEVPLHQSFAIESMTPLADVSADGSMLAWSLPDLAPLGESTVRVELAMPDPPAATVDLGARAWAFSSRGVEQGTAAPLVLAAGAIDGDLLASTPDADVTDRFIRRKAAELGYDRSAIFEFVRDEIRFEAYEGSLRGARGALWSEAGNAYDQASLLVALLRASGIPCRYVLTEGLAEGQARELLQQMFPIPARLTGRIPDDAEIADPLNDEQLLREAMDHASVEFLDGGAFVALDPSFREARVGDSFATPTQRVPALPEEVRHRFSIYLEMEMLGTGLATTPDGFETNVPLSLEFATAEVYAKPLAVGFLVQSEINPGGFFPGLTTHTYTPYLVVGENDGDLRDDEITTGEPVEEVFFAFASHILTKTDLVVDYQSPSGETESYRRALSDRIGPAARLQGTTIPPDELAGPALSPYITATVLVAPGGVVSDSLASQAERIAPIEDELGPLVDVVEEIAQQSTLTPEDEAVLARANELMTYMAILTGETLTLSHAIASDFLLGEMREGYLSAVYYDRPRLLIGQTDDDGENVRVMLDLRANDVRVVPYPGQNARVPFWLRVFRGFLENELEGQTLSDLTGEAAATTIEVFSALPAEASYKFLLPGEAEDLDRLDLSEDARARITMALEEGRSVIAPDREVALVEGGDPVSAWWETDRSGYLVGVMEDGGHLALLEYAQLLIAPGKEQLGFLVGGMHGFGAANILFLGEFIGNIASGQGAKEAVAAAIASATERAEEISERLEELVDNTDSDEPFVDGFVSGFPEGTGLGFDWVERNVNIDPPVLPFLSVDGSELPGRTVVQTIPVTDGQASQPIAQSFPFEGVLINGEIEGEANGFGEQRALGANALSLQSSLQSEPGVAGTFNLSTSEREELLFEDADIAFSGNGVRVIYPRPGSDLLRGASSWNSVEGTVDSSEGARIESEQLLRDGTLLPPGRYDLLIPSGSFSGSGNGLSPSFIQNTDVGGKQQSNSELTLSSSQLLIVGPDGELTSWTGFDGRIDVEDPATVRVDGTAANALQLSASILDGELAPGESTTVEADVASSLGGNVQLTFQAPEGFETTAAENGIINLRVQPGTPDGVYEVSVFAQHPDEPGLEASDSVTVTVTVPEGRGLAVAIAPDPLATASVGPGEAIPLPSGFLAEITNTGGQEEIVSLAFPELPTGFIVDAPARPLRILPGGTGRFSFVLEPEGDTLPAPGTVANFTALVSGEEPDAPEASAAGSFIVPEVPGLILEIDPERIALGPDDTTAEAELALRSFGNAQSSAVLTATTFEGVTVSGLPGEVQNATPGEEIVYTLTIERTSAFGPGGSGFIDFVADNCPSGTDCLPDELRFSRTQLTLSALSPAAACLQDGVAFADRTGREELASALALASSAADLLAAQPGDAARCERLRVRLVELIPLLAEFPSAEVSVQEALDALDNCDSAAALTALENGACVLRDLLQQEARYNIAVSLSPPLQTVVAGQTADYQVDLENLGTKSVTVDLAVADGLPVGVGADFDTASVLLEAGESRGTAALLEIDPTALSGQTFFGFAVSATPREAPDRAASAEGRVALRSSFADVLSVEATPAALEPGGLVELSAVLFNSGNARATFDILVQVFDRSGAVALADPLSPPPVTLDPSLDPVEIQLGSFSTDGLPEDSYTVRVSLTPSDGGGAGGRFAEASVLVGLPIEAVAFAEPLTVAPGDQPASSTLRITNRLGRDFGLGPRPETLNPVIEAVLDIWDYAPLFNQMDSNPAVIDMDLDGTPDIVLATHAGNVGEAVLRVVRGDDYSVLWEVRDESLRVHGASSPTVGDIDGDGFPEVLIPHMDDRLMAFEEDGTLKWKAPRIWGGIGDGSASLANLDGEGLPEIIIGATVLEAEDGSIRWQGNAAGGTGRGNNGLGALSVVADLDLDGVPEVVAGRTAYRADGSVFWEAALDDGFPGVADFDGDDFPEIVLVAQGSVYLLEHDGEVIWGPLDLPGRNDGGAPNIGDVDDDGVPEIGVAGGQAYLVIESDGTIKWEAETQDTSSGVTGSTMFDFNGDGRTEIVYGDELSLRIYRGRDGEVLYELPKSSGTRLEYPLVADSDGDGRAEILAPANTRIGRGPQAGLFIIGDRDNDWVPTRRVWNQHTYHVTNITDSGEVPIIEPVNWLQPGLNNFRTNTFGPGDEGASNVRVVIDHSFPGEERYSPDLNSPDPVPADATADSVNWDRLLPFNEPAPQFFGVNGTAPGLSPGEVREISTGTRIDVYFSPRAGIRPVARPEIIRSAPADGTVVVGLTTPTLFLREGVPASSVDPAGFAITGPQGESIPFEQLDLSNNRAVRLILSGPLDPGEYRVDVAAEAIANDQGLTLEAPFTFSFTVVEEPPDGVLRWIAGDGFWTDGANWSGGLVPTATDSVIIDVPGREAKVTIPTSGVEVQDIDNEERLVIGSLSVSGVAVSNGPIDSIPGGELIVTGSEASFIANAEATLRGTSISAFEGATVVFDGPTTVSLNATTGSVTMRARDTDSSIQFPNLVSVFGTDAALRLLAQNAGTVLVAGPSTIEDVSLIAEAEEAGSTVNLPTLTSYSPAEIDTLWEWRNGGQILAPNVSAFERLWILVNNSVVDFSSIESLDGCTVEVYNGSTAAFPLVTEYHWPETNRNRLFRADGNGSSLDLSALTALSSDGNDALVFQGRNEGFVDLSNLETVSDINMGLEAEFDGVVDASSLSSYTPLSIDQVFEWREGGALMIDSLVEFDRLSIIVNNTVVNFAGVTNIDGSSVDVVRGGSASFPDIDSYNVPEQNRNRAFVARDASSLLDLSALATLTSDGDDGISFLARNGGVVDISSLPSVSGVNMSIEGRGAGAQVDASSLASYIPETRDTFISWRDGGEALITSLATIERIRLVVNGEETDVSLGTITSADACDFEAYNGASLTLPNLAGYDVFGARRDIFSRDVDSTLSFPALAEISGSDELLAIESRNGGAIDMSALTTISHTNDTNVIARGAGSVVDLSVLQFYDPCLVNVEEIDGGQVLWTPTGTCPKANDLLAATEPVIILPPLTDVYTSSESQAGPVGTWDAEGEPAASARLHSEEAPRDVSTNSAFSRPVKARPWAKAVNLPKQSSNEQLTSVTLFLPPISINAVHIISIRPAERLVQAGEEATFQVELWNPTGQSAEYDLEVLGLEGFTVELPDSVSLAANERREETLAIRSAPFAPSQTRGFSVVATTQDGGRDAADAEVTIEAVPPADPEPRGVFVALDPANSILGRNMEREVEIRVTNVGDETTSYVLTADIPPTLESLIDNPVAGSVAPGESAFVTRMLTLSHAPDAEAGVSMITVTATQIDDPGVAGSAVGTVELVDQGVSVDLSPAMATEGDLVVATITNTGRVTDRYDLTLGGSASLGLSLPAETDELSAGESQQIELIIPELGFLTAQDGLFIEVEATSQINEQITGFDRVQLMPLTGSGFTALLDPAVAELPSPGSATFRLRIVNQSDAEEQYRVSTEVFTGTATAFLSNIAGRLTRSREPVVVLANGDAVIPIRANIAQRGEGTFQVRVAPAAQPDEAVVLTGRISTDLATPTPTPVVTPTATATPTLSPSPTAGPTPVPLPDDTDCFALSVDFPGMAHLGVGIDADTGEVRLVPARVRDLEAVLITRPPSDEPLFTYTYDADTAPNGVWPLGPSNQLLGDLVEGSLAATVVGDNTSQGPLMLVPFDGEISNDWPGDLEDWTFQNPAMFDGVEGGLDRDNSGLRMAFDSNVNSFAFFESPLHAICLLLEEQGSLGTHPSSLPLLGGQANGGLYVMEATVRANVEQREAPTMRLRISPRDFQQTDAIVVTSFGDAALSPGADAPRIYRHYFTAPPAGNKLRFNFDGLNFLPDNTAEAEFYLERSNIKALDPDFLGQPRSEYEISFAGNDHGWTPRIPLSEDRIDPVMTAEEEGLSIRGGEAGSREIYDPEQFGFWGSPEDREDVVLEAGRLYRVRATIGSDVPAGQAGELPAFRLRVNSSDLQFAAFANIESPDNQSRLPTADSDQEYSFLFAAPPALDGRSLIFSFDYIFTETGASNREHTLTLKRLAVDSFTAEDD